MIVLTVLSYSGVPAEGLSASFDELGGSIGRAGNNQLVLPDPERSISRMHARVVFRGGQYAIVDNGSNPVSVNGNAVPLGREQPLQPGDQLQIGSYLLSVSQAARGSAAPGSAFDDLFGDGVSGLAAPPPAPKAAAPAWGSPAAAAGGSGSAAPAPWGASAPAAADPWAMPPAAPRPPPPAAAPPAAHNRVRDEWDDLLSPTPKPGSAAAGAAPSWGATASPPPPSWGAPLPPPPFGSPSSSAPGLGLSLGPGSLDSLDALFGLGAPSATADPLGAAPQQALLLQPNMGAHADPLQSLGRPSQAAAASASDHVSELNTPMHLPRSQARPAAAPLVPRDAPRVAPPAAPAAVKPPPMSAAPSGAIFSWDDPPRDGRMVTLPGRPSAPRPAADDLVSLDELLAAPPAAASQRPPATQPPIAARQPSPAPAVPAPPFVASPRPAPAQHAAVATGAAGTTDETLLAALLQGLGAPGVRIDALTPELMLLIGQLLRESTRGAVELLLARAALKREMRAQMTMISAKENNPLKFSPSAEAALQHLLSPPSPGFMAPAPAMRDAFDDLRAHQMGVMAGMRAALDGVLQRFDPQHLEAKLSKRSAIDSLIPATRKARLWESFQQLFGQLSSEAQDDFDELFGKAFLAAYEEQLDRLSAEDGSR